MLYSDWLDQLLVSWISFLLVGSENYSSHNSLVWHLGFGGNNSLLFFVQYCRHHIETRQIQYHSLVYRTLVELVHNWKQLWRPKGRHLSDMQQCVYIIVHSILLNLLSCLSFGQVFPVLTLAELPLYVPTISVNTSLVLFVK